MKTKFRFIKRESVSTLYNRKVETDVIIEKKGWFGWKTLNLIYSWAGPGGVYYSWCYFQEPKINGYRVTFKTKKEAIKFLDDFYKNNRSNIDKTII